MIEIAQARGAAPAAPLGVVYNTSMTRPDAAFAVAAIHALSIRRECRMGSVCVTGAGLEAAIYCDILDRFYNGAPKNSNTALPVGLAAVKPLAADPPMVKAVVEKKRDTGESQYVRSVKAVSDTSLAEAVLRNGVSFNAEGVMVLSAPATSLAKTFDLQDGKPIYQERIKRLVLVDAGTPQADPAGLRRVVAEWPTPIAFIGKDVGEALLYPGAKLAELFSWAPAHPLVDAYTAYKPMPYDAPLWDLAAIYYALHPDAPFFTTEQGSIKVNADGTVQFVAGAGAVKRVTIDPAKRAEALETLIGVTTTKPPAPAAGRGRGAA